MRRRAGLGPLMARSETLRLEGLSPGLRTPMYPYVALRCPTYRDNSHANHTWRQHSHETACFLVPAAPSLWVRFPSPAPLLRQPQATQGNKIWVKTLILWESLGRLTLRRWRSHCLTFPTSPQDSHVQSHAAVHKNKLCDSHAPLVAGAIAGGWTRPSADLRECLE
jgi:hypothetical protein